ncbi:MAG: helix-turn-helix domain-containing protein [Rhodospirillaceae bacterium]
MLKSTTAVVPTPAAVQLPASITGLLTTREVAAVLRVNPGSVERWRRTGAGPPFRRLSGGAIRYSINDVNAFIAAAERRSTADRGRA